MLRALFPALLLCGCASSGYEPADDESEFHKVAISWVGAPISEMIAKWGEPNNLKVDSSESRDGLARWRATNNTAGFSSGTGADTRYYTCIAEARYGLDGVISKIDTVSSNCDKLYTDQNLAQMTR